MQNNSNEQHKDLKSLLDQIKIDLSSYIENRLRYYQLKVYEKSAITGSFIGYGLIVCLVLFNIFTLVLLALGCFIGEYLNSYALGFSVLILVACLLLAIIMINAKRIRRFIVNLTISIIHKVEKDEE